MKLIIDIEKEKYEWIKTHNLNLDNNSIVGAVANGIPYEETISAYEIAGQRELKRQDDLNNIKFVKGKEADD